MKKLTLITAIMLTANLIFAQIINIPADYPTIQQGIDAAIAGDTVLVDQGTYVENIVIDKSITLASLYLTALDTSYISTTVIDGNSAGSVVTINNNNDSTTVLCGFTITNGNAEKGGGIYCYSANPTLKNLIIKENETHAQSIYEAGGGGLYFYLSHVQLQNLVIKNNTVYHSNWSGNNGGGILAFYSNIQMENVRVVNNISHHDGGGIYLENSMLKLTDGNITSNSSGSYGGGIYGRDCSFIELSDVNIANNSSDDIGGGIYLNSSPTTISNSSISGNHCDGTGFWYGHWGGGGIYSKNSNPELVNVSIVGNTCPHGGGCHFDHDNPQLVNVLISYNHGGTGGGILCTNSIAQLTNVTIANNDASVGGAICEVDNLFGNSHVKLTNCILYYPFLNQEIYLGQEDTLTIRYSVIQGGEEGIITNNSSVIFWLEGNIDEDPLFVDCWGENFQINDNSPCIDAGTPDTTGLNLPEFDLAGEVRYINDRVDMGAYEWNLFVGIEEYVLTEKESVDILLFPNPAHNQIEISCNIDKAEDMDIVIYSLIGQKMLEYSHGAVLPGQFSHTINISKLPKGTYLLRMRVGVDMATKKIVKL